MRKPFVITILIRKEFFRNQEIRKNLLSDLARAGLSSKDSHGYKRTVTALASPVQHRLPRIPYPCPMKDLLRTEDLSRVDVDLLLDTAAEFATNPLRSTDALAHRTVAIYIRGDELQIGRGETIADTAKVISGFASALIIRTFAQSDVDELGFHASIPVINALTDSDHPTQLLADWLTIREVFGSDISGRKFTYIGDGNNMAQAWLTMGAIMGAHVVVASPSGQWAPDSAAVARASAIAAKTGGKVEVVHDPAAAAKDSSVLYTDVWMSMGDPESDRRAKLAALSPFAVTAQLMDLAAPDVIFLHCLPAHRGEEVSAEVIDGPRSYIWRQAYHRRSTIQAILYHLVRGELQGSALLD
jgi:ornithine carbamoyltransferase